MKPKSNLDPTDRDLARLNDVESVMRRLLKMAADFGPRSENR